MKKINLIIVFISLIATYTFGQDDNTDNREKLQFGIKAGANYSNVYDTEGDEFKADPKFGLVAGICLSIPLNTFLGIQPGLLYSQKGFKAEGNLLNNTYSLTHTTNYIDIPLLISLKPNAHFSILAGPQYSYLISQKNLYESGKTTIEQEQAFDNEDLRKNMFCLTGGVDFNFNPLVIGARVGGDLFRNNGDGTTTTPQYKNLWYQLTLGIRIY